MTKKSENSEAVEMTTGLSRSLQLKLLGSIVEFMTRSGVSEASITEAFESGIKQSRDYLKSVGGRDVAGRYPSAGDVSAHLLRLWHRDHRFIDSACSKPRPLHLSKGRYSLRRLVLSLDPNANATDVLNAMKTMGLIRRTRDGRYVPTASAAVVSGLHPWAVEHAAKSIVRLVSTVLRNANPDSESPPLLERYSYVPDLKPSEALAFAEFARSQGQAYLDVLDDWLEQRRVGINKRSRSVSETGIAAGVHLITYLGGGDSDSIVGAQEQFTNAGVASSNNRARGTTSKASRPPPSTPS